MKFSIITVVYNEEKRIKKTLESVYMQNYKDFEHIIEDGGSTDSTLKVTKSNSHNYLSNQLKIFSEKDNGIYDAMNRAVKRAKGEYICFINSGDYLFDSDTLLRVATEIEENNNYDWYYGTAIIIYPNNNEFKQVQTSIENHNGHSMYEYLSKKNLNLNHQSIFAKRSCLEKFPFNDSYKLRGELNWYYDCLLNGIRIKKMEFPVCKYALGGISESAKAVPLYAEEVKRIRIEHDLLNDTFPSLNSNLYNFQNCKYYILNQWLSLRQSGVTFDYYLRKRGIRTVAIYGYADLGTHLINELRDTSITIRCIIDREDHYPYSGIKVVNLENFTDEVDMIIVTVLEKYNEILNNIRIKTEVKVCSIESIIEEMWLE